jgi:hypothetical protein
LASVCYKLLQKSPVLGGGRSDAWYAGVGYDTQLPCRAAFTELKYLRYS